MWATPEEFACGVAYFVSIFNLKLDTEHRDAYNELQKCEYNYPLRTFANIPKKYKLTNILQYK